MKIKKFSSLLLAAMLTLAFGTVSFAEEGDTPDGQLPAGETETVDNGDSYTLDPNAKEATQSGDATPPKEECFQNICKPSPEYASGWQLVTGDYWGLSTSGRWITKTSKVVTGKGGNFKVNIPDHAYSYASGTTPTLEVKLYEDDPTGDDFIGSWIYYPKGKTSTVALSAYIGDEVDGADGDAELYYKYSYNYKANSGSMYVTYWD